jgi:hypothetical protein
VDNSGATFVQDINLDGFGHVTGAASVTVTPSLIGAPQNDGTGATGTWGISISGNANNVSGTVSVSNGGTGATTAGQAVTNLGAAPLASPAFTGDVSIEDKIVHTGDTNTAIRFPAADTVTVETSGVERLRVADAGAVGIGVTPSAWASPAAIALEFPNGANLFSSTASVFQMGANNFYDGAYKYKTNGFASRYRQDSGTHLWDTVASGTAGNAITFVRAMTLDASGNLSVTGTASATTASVGTNTTQLATTAFVNAEIANDAPTKTGGGASGTWNIAISGNAATATTADQIDGVGFRNTDSNSAVNADTLDSNGITYYTAGVPNFTGNATDGALYSQAYSSSWQHQIAADYRSGQIALRGKNNGTWQSWRTVLDSSNYTSYAPSLTGSGASGNWGINVTGNAATTSQRAFSGDISTTGQGRFTGWYSGGAATGAATEVGVSGGQSYILGYNRDTSTYIPLNISTSGANMSFNGSAINVTSGALQQGGNQVLHAGNYTSYSPPYTGGTLTGSWYFQSNANTGSSTGVPLQAYSSSGGAIMAFHRAGVYAVNMGLDSDNVFRIGGWSAGANLLQMDMSGNLTMANNVTAYSDIRLKEDLEPIIDAIEKVQSLTGYTYTRIDSGQRQTGLIAQEVQKVLPEAVMDNGEHLSLAYGNMVGLLIEAIKAQQVQIDELRAKLGV